jgi:hypothetical protein
MKIPDLQEIAVAWMRAANPTPEQQATAETRLAICEACPQKAFKQLTRMYVCDACGCPLNKKVFSPKGATACPLGNWAE